MSAELLNALIERELSAREQASGRRVRTVVRALDSTHVEIDSRRYINFASNNYLGLTHHPKVMAAAVAAIGANGVGSCASSLISGYTEDHARSESAIAAWKGTEAAILLPSGYQTAHAVVQTITGVAGSFADGAGFYLDKLVHASLIDAVLGSKAPYRIFPHNHLEKLDRLLREAPEGQLSVVVTESIFSMDGDSCDLDGLAELKRRQPFFLLLDEAHGSGVYGDAGAGYAAERKLQSAVDASIVTLSKAVGVSGGAVCASKSFCEAILNWGRAFIYSTSVPAAQAAATTAAIQVMRDEPQRQTRVRELARRVRGKLQQAGLKLPSGDSPIIPIILGEEQRALEASERLRDKGILALAIRPPTVARGTSRLRVTLSCDHTDEEIDRLIAALIEICG
jgi:8-amino-7-oxononanoate synthase